jgi:hypothetical protein
MSAFFGNMMIALRTSISSTTLSLAANTTTSSVTAGGGGGRGTYTYLWSQSGTTCTITSSTSAATTFTGSGVAGTTTVFCNIRDSRTGNTLNTPTCTITWTAVSVNQNVAISGTLTFNGAAQAFTLTGTPASPAPTGSPSSFTNVGTYTYPTNITSITPGAGYTLGTVSGSFTINRKAITSYSASYVYLSTASFWIVYSVTFGGGVPGGTFNNFVISIASNATAGDSLIPVTISGTFNGSGVYTYTFPNGGSVVFATPVNSSPGFLGLNANSSTNYSGTLTAALIKAV